MQFLYNFLVDPIFPMIDIFQHVVKYYKVYFISVIYKIRYKFKAINRILDVKINPQ